MDKKPNLNKIIAENLNKDKFQSKAKPSLPTSGWLDGYKSGGTYISDRAQATQFGQYAEGGSSWMLTNPNRISTFFPRMNNGGGLLSKTVTCSNCGHSWKGVEGAADPLTCHNCGGMIKMDEGGVTTQTTIPPTTQDSVRHLAGQMMDFEATKGSPSGTGLSDWGYHSSQLPFNKVSANWHAPQTKEAAVDMYMQEIGNNPILGYFNSAMEKGEAGDFLYNTGRDPRVYMLDQYLRSKGQSGLPNRGSYNIDTKTAQWTPELQNSLDQAWNQYSGEINKLPVSQRRILLNKGRDFYYQNINQVNGKPNPAYEATWKPRIWESVNTYKKNGGDISIPDLDQYQVKGQVTAPNFMPNYTMPKAIQDNTYRAPLINVMEIDAANKQRQQQDMINNSLKKQTYIKQGHAETAQEKAYRAEQLRKKAQENSDLAQSFGMLTPMGSNPEAGAIAANDFVNMNPVISGPIMSTSRLYGAGRSMFDPNTYNPYFSSDKGIVGNTLGGLQLAGDLGMMHASTRTPEGSFNPEPNPNTRVQYADFTDRNNRVKQSFFDNQKQQAGIPTSAEEYRKLLQQQKLKQEAGDILRRTGTEDPTQGGLYQAPSNKLIWKDPKTGEIRYEVEAENYNNFKTPELYKEAQEDFRDYKRDYWQKLIDQRNANLSQAKQLGSFDRPEQYNSKMFSKKNLIGGKQFPGFDIPDYFENLGADMPMYYNAPWGERVNVSGIEHPNQMTPYKGIQVTKGLNLNRYGGSSYAGGGMITDPNSISTFFPRMQNGGGNASGEAQKQFLLNWNNSPMAQQMLRASVEKDDPLGSNSSYVNKITKQRNYLTSAAPITVMPQEDLNKAYGYSGKEATNHTDLGGFSFPIPSHYNFLHNIPNAFINPASLFRFFGNGAKHDAYSLVGAYNPQSFKYGVYSKDYNGDLSQQKETLIHELSHASDYGGKFIPRADKNKMDRYAFGNWSPMRNKFLGAFQEYVAEPTETRARLNTFRYNAKNQNLYNPFTQKITKDLLDKYKRTDNPDVFGYDPLLQLREVYSDDQIVDLLNSISKSDNGQPQTTAKYGGWLKKYQRAGQVSIPGVTDFKMTPNATESTAHSFYNPMLGRQTNTATTGVNAQNMATSSNAIGQTIKRQRDDQQKKINYSKQANYAIKNPTTPFTLPNGQTKPYNQMDFREKAYVNGQGVQSDFRVSDKPNWFDDNLNILNTTLGRMAGNLAMAPYEAKEKNSNMPYVSAIGEPLLTGAFTGMGEEATPAVSNAVPTTGLKNKAINLGRDFVHSTGKVLNPVNILKTKPGITLEEKTFDKAKEFGIDKLKETGFDEFKGGEGRNIGMNLISGAENFIPKRFGGMITDPMGQWAHPGENTRIPGGDITMQGVPYPVLAKASNGMSAIMQPGQDYNFPGASHVDEYPMTGWLNRYQFGGGLSPILATPGSPIMRWANHEPTNVDLVASVADPTGFSNVPFVTQAGRKFVQDPSWSNAADLGWNLLGSIPFGIGSEIRDARNAPQLVKAAQLSNDVSRAQKVGRGAGKVLNTVDKVVTAPARAVDAGWKAAGVTPTLSKTLMNANLWNRGERAYDAGFQGVVGGLNYMFPGTPQKRYGGQNNNWLNKYK
jgi:hypothetical protein